MSKNNGFLSDEDGFFEYPEWAKEFLKGFSERHPGPMFKEGQNPYAVFNNAEEGKPTSTFADLEPPPLTVDSIQKVIDALRESSPPHMPADIIYSEYAVVTYVDRIECVISWPCRLHVLKHEKMEPTAYMADESKIAPPEKNEPKPVFALGGFCPPGGLSGDFQDFQTKIISPIFKPRCYIVAHPYFKDEIESNIKETLKGMIK